MPSSTTSQSERSKKRRVDRTHANPDQADDTAAILRLNCPVCLESLQTVGVVYHMLAYSEKFISNFLIGQQCLCTTVNALSMIACDYDMFQPILR